MGFASRLVERRWAGRRTIKVAVNLSAVQFQHGDIVASVVGALAQSGLPATRLELEITELLFMEESERNLRTLESLRRLGVTISMDDFGAGFSSLGYLRTFPFDKLKIDQSFVPKTRFGSAKPQNYQRYRQSRPEFRHDDGRRGRRNGRPIRGRRAGRMLGSSRQNLFDADDGRRNPSLYRATEKRRRAVVNRRGVGAPPIA